MARRGILLAVLGCAGAVAMCEPSIVITVRNPARRSWSEAPIVLSMERVDPEALGRNPVLVGAEILPVQLDDLNQDGKPEEMAFLAGLAPNEEKRLTLAKNGCEFSPPPRAHAGMYKREFEGPGWESDRLAFRLYWDERNAIDLFGKKKPTLGLAGYARKGVNYHQDTPWGMDILKVGPSLGAGGFGVWADGRIQKVGKADRDYRVLADGPLRCVSDLVYRNWVVGERRLDLTARISMIAGQHFATIELWLVPLDDGPAPELVAGIVKHEETTLIQDKTAGILGRWGLQSLGPGEVPKGGHLGLGVIVDPTRVAEFGEDDNNSFVRLRGEDRPLPGYGAMPRQSYVRYRIHASWALEPGGAATGEEYEGMLRSLSGPQPTGDIATE